MVASVDGLVRSVVELNHIVGELVAKDLCRLGDPNLHGPAPGRETRLHGVVPGRAVTRRILSGARVRIGPPARV